MNTSLMHQARATAPRAATFRPPASLVGSGRRQISLALATLAIALSAVCPQASAQDYPNKPIRMLVGFPPGGGVDIAARTLGQEISKSLGQPVIIENRAGAAGGIAAELAAKSAPDGYTLMMGNTGSLTINPSLYAKLAYDPLRDFTPVSMVSTTPLIFLVHPASPAESLADLVAMARKNPGKLNFGSASSGGITHLAIELLKLQANVNMTHIPYRGSAPAVSDLMGGQLDLLVEGLPLATPLITSKKIRALAIMSAKRSPLLPDVPTVAEAGFPDLKVTAWYGVVAPTDTPALIVDKLNKAIQAALADPAFVKKLALQGSDPATGTPAQFGDYIKQELIHWSGAVKASGAKAE